MSQGKSSKISTDGSSSELDNNPFGALEVSGLPAGEVIPSVDNAASQKKSPSKGRVEVRREKAGRGGKTVTTLKEFSIMISLKELESLTFDLKKSCACGGTLKNRTIELQGDVRDRVVELLEASGFKPLRAGG
ncbi:MAG: translation initiation factor [Lentimonas sp.]